MKQTTEWNERITGNKNLNNAPVSPVPRNKSLNTGMLDDDDDDDDDDDTIEFNNEFCLTRFNNALAPLIFFLALLPLDDGVDGEGDDGTGVDPVDTRNLLLLDGDGDGSDGEASVADSPLTLFTFSSLGSWLMFCCCLLSLFW